MESHADTSVWVDYLNGTDTPAASALAQWLAAAQVCIGDLVMMEVLQGLREERVRRVSGILGRLPARSMCSPELAVAAAANYRALRRRGITVRSTIDCLIATYCIESGAELLHSDHDFDPFEEHLGLRVARP